jgi:hypothetical protein
VTPRTFVRIKKLVVKPGEWKVVTRKAGMPKTTFPLSRRDGIQLGRGWHWRVDSLEITDHPLRLLTAFHQDKEEFRAWLSTPRGQSHVILAQLEFHGDHPGWHCHAACCAIDEIEAGDSRPRKCVRIPRHERPHRDITFAMSESSALARAYKFFRVTGTPKDALL